MTRYALKISIFAIIMWSNVNGIILSKVELENDSSEIVTNGATKVKIENDSSENIANGEHDVEKCERTSLLFGFTPRGKRDIPSRRRKATEKLEILKIPERGKDVECGNFERSASVICAWQNEEKKHRRHTNSCVICDVSFWYDKDYVNHCAEKHGNLQPYCCPHCERKFKWKRNLKQHVDERHDATHNPYSRWNRKRCQAIKCEICGETSPNLSAFEHHALSQHAKERMMACPYCPKKYLRRSALSTHLNLKHEGGDDEEGDGECNLFSKRVFRTKDCVKGRERFEGKDSKQEQIGNIKAKIENREDQINLNFPGKGMPSATAQECEQNQNDSSHHEGMVVKVKRKNIGIYKCPHCNLDVIGLVEYEKHCKSMHEGLPLYQCEKCEKGFYHRNTIISHYKEKHNNDKIRCSTCSKCYNHIGTLRRHEYACEKRARNEALHKEQGLPSYTCNICKRVLYTKWKSFKKHVAGHKKFVYCHICKQGFNKFNNSQGLAEHIRVRHPLLENIDALLKMAAKVKVKCENVDELRNENSNL